MVLTGDMNNAALASNQAAAVKRAAALVTSYDRSLWSAKLAGLAERWPNLAIATALYIAEAA